MNRLTAPVLVALLGVCGCHPSAAPVKAVTDEPIRKGNAVQFPKDSPLLAKIRVGTAEDAQVPQEELTAPGKVELNPARVARVILPFPGRVREVKVTLGDSVKQGQPVLTLESQEVSAIQSAIRQADANIAQSKANQAKAEADLARTKDLLANRAIAQKEVLTAETVVAQAKAGVEVALATRDEAARRLQLLGLQPGSMSQLIMVPAPMAGKVMDISVAAGEFRADAAAPVITIADLSSVWVSADVPEDSIRLITVGEDVAITLNAFPDKVFTGKVKRIGDLVDPQTRTIKVRAELPNAGGQLRPEMFATIRHSHGRKASVVVPKAALYQQQDKTTLYLERGPGLYEEVPVVVSWQDAQRAAVSGDVHAGDRVVIDGVTQLRAY